MKQAARFVLIGGGATVVHLCVGTVLILWGIAPLMANAIAFGTAFGVSFAGHFLFTFRGHGRSARSALPRFCAVALSGFAINQLTLRALIGLIPEWPVLALCLGAAVAAIWNYAVSRAWAFAAPPLPGTPRSR